MTHSPAVGATVANNAAYDVRIDVSGDRGHYFTTIAFVRDDGVYSQPAMCGETDAGSGGGSGGLGFGQTHEVRKTIDRLNFAIGRRVNLVVLFSSRGGCDVGPSAPTVDPSQADLGRRDVTLNWLVGGAD